MTQPMFRATVSRPFLRWMWFEFARHRLPAANAILRYNARIVLHTEQQAINVLVGLDMISNPAYDVGRLGAGYRRTAAARIAHNLRAALRSHRSPSPFLP